MPFGPCKQHWLYSVFLVNRSQEKEKLISRGYKQNTAANPVGPTESRSTRIKRFVIVDFTSFSILFPTSSGFFFPVTWQFENRKKLVFLFSLMLLEIKKKAMFRLVFHIFGYPGKKEKNSWFCSSSVQKIQPFKEWILFLFTSFLGLKWLKKKTKRRKTKLHRSVSSFKITKARPKKEITVMLCLS